MSLFRTALFFCLLGCSQLVTPLLWSQIDRGSISGVVVDSTGAVVPGVEVRLASPATGYTRRVETSSSGLYLAPALPVGLYDIVFSKSGFQSRRIENVQLVVGGQRTINTTIEISTNISVVEVTADTDPLQQANGETGLVVNDTQIKSLPMNGRNWTGFLMLAPGATNTGDGSQNSVRFNGRSRDDNNFTFDGVDATGVKDPRQEANLRLNISLDSIAEFRVSSGLYTAESGNGAGAQMNLVSKGGTNDFHGGLFEYFRNDKLDARRPIDAAKPPFRLNQFGGNLGGRFIRDRTFFFVNYEGLEQRLGQTFINTVPSQAFKDRAAAASPALRNIVNAYRAGTSRSANPDIDNLVTQGSQPSYEKSGFLRLDHRFNAQTSIFGRYNVDDGVIQELRNVLLQKRISNFRTQNGVVQLQRLFGPSIITETRLGLNRSALRRDTVGDFGEGVSIPGFVGLQVNRAEVEIGTSLGLTSNVTWIKGPHTWKFGGEVRKVDLVLSDTGQVQTSFSSRDNFVLNRADSVQFSAAQPGLKGLRPYYFAFAQDEVKLSPALMLSLGTRYEYYSVARTNDGRGRVFDFERCGGFCAPGSPWYFPDRNNWAPRLGLAWTPAFLGGRTVFRSGFGIFYGPGQIDDVNAAIDSFPETFSLTARDQPALSFPAVQFLSQARSTGVSARALQRDRRDGYSQQWTFSVQHRLPGETVLQTSYVGSNGHKLFGRSFVNTIDAATGRRPYPNFSNVDIKNNFGNSSMQSLQVSLNRSPRRGLQWQTQYMWSHNINDNAGAGDGANWMISNCRRCERGNADWDVRHTLSANAVYALPFDKAFGGGTVAGKLLGGWTVSGLGMARTGLPFSVTVNRAVADIPDGVASTPGRAAPTMRASYVASVPLYATTRGPGGWLNAAAFVVPGRGTWGNVPRNALRGPRLWQTDIALAKRTSLTERVHVDFRAELFNLFNRAQYANPNANISNPALFGTITNTVNASPTGQGGPRQVQLMLRLSF